MMDLFNDIEREIIMNKFINTEIERMGYYELDNDIDRLTLVQYVFAKLFTFENIDVLTDNKTQIDEQFLIDKLLTQKRGGLCYEINGALYLVLKKLGFNVRLGSATVWSKEGWIIDRTHTVVMLYIHDELYLLDSGSGTNLSIRPLALNGEPVQSPVGIFRLRTENTERGSIVSEKLTEDGWILRYAFYPMPVELSDDLNRIKDMIHDHPESPFNKEVLVARTLEDGTVSINNERLSRKWVNKEGFLKREERIEFKNNSGLLEAIKEYASKSTYEAAKSYLNQ